MTFQPHFLRSNDTEDAGSTLDYPNTLERDTAKENGKTRYTEIRGCFMASSDFTDLLKRRKRKLYQINNF